MVSRSSIRILVKVFSFSHDQALSSREVEGNLGLAGKKFVHSFARTRAGRKTVIVEKHDRVLLQPRIEKLAAGAHRIVNIRIDVNERKLRLRNRPRGRRKQSLIETGVAAILQTLLYGGQRRIGEFSCEVFVEG